MNIGRKVYYDVNNGNVILITDEMQHDVIETTIEDDIATYKSLSERIRESFDMIQLEYGQYSKDFAECNGYRVNLETHELEFSYPDPNEPNVEQPFRPPLSMEVEKLKVAQATTDSTLLEFMETTLLGGM